VSQPLLDRTLNVSGAPECFRNEYDGLDKRTSRSASPNKDVFSLGCVFSEALVWSTLGAKGVEAYRLMRRASTEKIAELRRTAYSGCFHDGERVLSAVKLMHEEVRTSCGDDLPVLSDLALIIEDMLSSDSVRPSAPEVRRRLLRVIRDAVSTRDISTAGFELTILTVQRRVSTVS